MSPAAARLLPVAWATVAVGTAFGASIAAGALAGTTLPLLLGTSVSRSGMNVAGVACVGLGLLGVLLPAGAAARSHGAARELARLHTAADRGLAVMGGSWLLLVVLGTVFRSADAFGRPVSALGAGEVIRWTTQLSAGRGMILTGGCAAAVLGCAVYRLRDPDGLQVRIPLVAALLGTLTPAVTGHAGSASDHQLAVVTVALHVAAAAVWVGGLSTMLVFVARNRELLGTALPRFSRLAGICIAVIGLTGMLNAQFRIESWDALLSTGYGWLVISKAVLLVVIGGFGGLTRRRLHAGRMPVLRWAGAETALMAAVLGLAAALTQTGT